ncbi:MAG TPA: DUF4149 domain-containing protein [Gemmatales bacterium]|nr:DUF4149 domain-containing protein [Gemmatales bacterium]
MLLKVILVISLGLWSGAVMFFSFFVALPVISEMKKLAQTSGNWLNLRTEQEGTRLAGEFLNVVFARYFPFQCICGLLALFCALWWWSLPGWIHKVRVLLIALALTGAICNLTILAPRVHELRTQRYDTDLQKATEAQKAFGTMHTISLLVDMSGLLAALGALALTVKLPE